MTDPVKGDCRVWEKDRKEMVRVPAGEFLYGDEKQKISLPEFWIDKTPVTPDDRYDTDGFRCASGGIT